MRNRFCKFNTVTFVSNLMLHLRDFTNISLKIFFIILALQRKKTTKYLTLYRAATSANSIELLLSKFFVILVCLRDQCTKWSLFLEPLVVMETCCLTEKANSGYKKRY